MAASGVTAEVQDTTPSEPTAGRRSSKERANARALAHAKRERPNGAAKPGGPAQPEHEVPTWPWPWRVDSRESGFPLTNAHRLRRPRPPSALVLDPRVQDRFAASVDEPKPVPRHRDLHTNGVAHRPYGWERRAWCRSPFWAPPKSGKQRPRAAVRRGRPLGLNRGRKRWRRRERRPHGKLVQQRFPRRNRDPQAHPPANTLLGDGHGRRGGAAKEKHAEKVRRETRRRRGRDGRERKSRQIGNGVALAVWECTEATELPTGNAVPQLSWQRTAIRVWTYHWLLGTQPVKELKPKTGSRTLLWLG